MNLFPIKRSGVGYGTSVTATAALLAALATADLQAQTPGKLVAFWDFNDATSATTTPDVLHSFPGLLQNGAVFSEDQGGRTSQAGDRAMDFGTTSQSQLVRVSNVGWLNQIAAADQMTVTYWQKLRAVVNGSAFWMTSPSSSGTARGSQAHSPWGDRTVYWDTAGCCGGTQRLNAGIDTLAPDFPLTEWHHFAFVKNGDYKQIYVDGQLLIDAFGYDPLPTDFTQLVMGAETAGANSIQGWLDDFAIFAAPLTEEQVQSLASGASPTSLDADTDNDGMPDWWEDENGFDKNNPADAALDADSDGSTNLAEYRRTTDPRNPDTDGDGLLDGAETDTGVWVNANDTGTSPFKADTDGDGLPDGVETNTGTFVDANNTGTNPVKVDTDGDQFPDGTETQLGSNPNEASSTPLKVNDVNLLAYWSFNDASVADQTKDLVHNITGTLTNGAVFTADQGGRTGQAGDRAIDFYGFDENVQRVDAPGWFASASAPGNSITISFWQILYETPATISAWLNSPSSGGGRGAATHNPWSDRTIYWDTAGCCDGATQRINKTVDEAFDFAAWHHYAFVKSGSLKQIWIDGELFHEGNSTSPLPADFDRLFIGGAPGFNSVQGAIDDFAVFAKGLTAPEIAALALGIAPDQIGGDDDGDGMSNVWEIANGFNPQDPSDAPQDADNDGLTNLAEFLRNTDPRNPDTDGDGVNDGAETGTGVWVSATDRGTNPLNPDSDGDGLSDGVETNTGTFVNASDTGSNPNVADTDNDTFLDGVEVSLGSNPVSAASQPVTPGQLNLLAFWNFNNAGVPNQAIDTIHGFVGAVESTAAYTPDQGGRTGAAGDYAMDFGYERVAEENRVVRVSSAPWLNAASTLDQMTISLWQKLYYVEASSTFWLVSPSSTDGQRGFQAHIPWSNNRIYFDTAGCCGAPQRIDQDIAQFDPDFDFTAWHHYVFVKDGGTKQIWIDGELFHSGTGAAPLPSDFTQLIIGNNSGGNANVLGVVDDYLIYAAALTPEEIALLAQGTLPPERAGASVALQSSASITGAFATDAGATWNETTKTFTTTVDGDTRYYRISADSALTIQSISIEGNTVTIVYQ